MKLTRQHLKAIIKETLRENEDNQWRQYDYITPTIGAQYIGAHGDDDIVTVTHVENGTVHFVDAQGNKRHKSQAGFNARFQPLPNKRTSTGGSFKHSWDPIQ